MESRIRAIITVTKYRNGPAMLEASRAATPKDLTSMLTHSNPDTIQKTGKRGKTGLHGNQRRGRKVEYVAITCEVCGTVREYPPSEARRRGVIRYCSRQCMAVGQRKPGTHVEITCAHCGSPFTKRHDHLRERNYCSLECSAEGRRVDGAKWRDPEQIAGYMKTYLQRNRKRHNKRSRNWARANREKRNANQQARRANGQGRGFMGRLRSQMLALHGDNCLKCGTGDRIEIDHVIPTSLGGKNELSNVQPLCRTCNGQKSATIADYRIVQVIHGIEIQEIKA